MSDQRIENSRYVVYVLQREEEASLVMKNAPEGWQDDELEIVRNKKYHGILTQFTGGLIFRGREKEFIEDAYALRGINTNLYLVRYKLKVGKSYVVGDTIDTVKFDQQYRGIADFDTMKVKKGGLEVNFNSQELEKLIESYQSDALSIGRKTDLEDEVISPMKFNKTKIKGRDLNGVGWAKNVLPIETGEHEWQADNAIFSIPTMFGVKGFGRHVEVTDNILPYGDSLGFQPVFFYDDVEGSVELSNKVSVRLKFKIKVELNARVEYIPKIYPVLQRFRFNGNGYDWISEEWIIGPFVEGEWIEFDGLIKVFDFGDLKNTDALAIVFKTYGYEPPLTYYMFKFVCQIDHFRIDIEETSRYEDDGLYNFSFINDVGSRLTEIITGKKNKFYSKVFGRDIELSNQNYQDYKYVETGEWGNIGLIHGFNLRKFTVDNQLYKYMEISMKDLMDSLVATFNIGVGIENSSNGQRLRFEKRSHFYRPERVIKLPFQVIDVEREVDPKMFNSSGSFGSVDGGNYEYGLGLDEPNVKTDYIFPLRKTKNKYVENSEIRSDETGAEIVRRQPEYLDATKDTDGDEQYWYLDLKKSLNGNYEQLDWNDALVRPPIGVISPETYRSWRFTPKRCMFRHGNIIRAGMEQDITLQKYTTLGSSNANINLETEYLPNVAPSEKLGIVSEKLSEKCGKFDSALMLPEIIKCKHQVDDELMDWILGTTPVVIGGEVEQVPNWYFKMEFTNEKEEQELGYLISLKPKSGAFEFYKSNDKFKGVIEGSGYEVTMVMSVYHSSILSRYIRFRVGGIGFIRWNDGTPDTHYNGHSVEIEHRHLLPVFDKDIEFYGTLTLFDCQQTNLNCSHDIADLPEEINYYWNEGINETYGDVANLPRFLSLFVNKGLNTITGNVSDLPPGITEFNIGGLNTVTGNISDAVTITLVNAWICAGENTVSNYTAGVRFNPEIFSFTHLPKAGNGLSSTEVDNILIDLDISGMHIGSIIMYGSNAPRTSASDAAYANLSSRGIFIYLN
jgi:hypothetical protein